MDSSVESLVKEKFKHIPISSVTSKTVDNINFFRVQTSGGILIYYFLNPCTKRFEELCLDSWPPNISDINYVNVITGNKKKLLAQFTH